MLLLKPFTQYLQTPYPLLKGAVEGSEEGVHSFWLSAIADGQKIKELRVQTEKEASKKANFPGFRKVRDVLIEQGECKMVQSTTSCSVLQLFILNYMPRIF